MQRVQYSSFWFYICRDCYSYLCWFAAENAGVRASEADPGEEGPGAPVLQRCEEGDALTEAVQ